MKPYSMIVIALASCVYAHTASAQSLQARSWAAACANCHGTNGQARPGMEALAGRTDIAQKMLDFKSGRKPATVMHQLAKGYSDEQIQQIAAYFAAQTPAAK